MRFITALVVVNLMACGGKVLDEGLLSDAGLADSGDEAISTTDSIAIDVDTGCEAVTSSATDVFVDAAAKTAGNGSKICPFRTLSDAVAAPLDPGVRRSISVAAGRYEEKGAIVIPKDVFIAGAGATITTLVGKGVCPRPFVKVDGEIDPAPRCTAFVGEGATLAGMKIETAPSDAGDVAVMTARGAALRGVHVMAFGTGVVTNDDTELEDVHIEGMGEHMHTGIVSRGTGTLKLSAASVIEKVGAGIVTLDEVTFDGFGFTIRNCPTGPGLALLHSGKPGTPLTTHTVRYGTITGNGLSGIQADTMNLVVRSSTILGNGYVGILYAKTGSGNVLDLGSPPYPGNNVFGGVTASNHNKCAAVKVGGDVGGGAILAAGNTWSSCAPVQSKDPEPTSGASCSTYADVVYAGSSAPLAVASSCTVGP